jgi:hypothetical protein
MTNSDQSDFPIGARTSVSLEEFLNSSNAWISTPTPVESTKERRTYNIEIDDDTHWALVSIAAKQKLHQEDFVENLLVEFVAEHHAAMTLREGIEIDKTIENNIQPISFNDRLPGDEDVDEDGCCWIWNKAGKYWDLAYVRTRVKDGFSFPFTRWLPYSAIVFPEATS